MEWIKNASECPILRGINELDLERLFQQINVQLKRYSKEQLVAMQGEEVSRLMILLRGSVRGEMTDLSGQMIKIEDIEAPKPLAGAFLFGSENTFPVDVVANNDVELLVIYRDEFLKLMQLNQRIQINYLNLVSNKAQFLSRKIRFLSFKSIKGKIVQYLLELHSHADNEVKLPVSQQQLADLFGVARPSVARGFKQLEEEGGLQVKNRYIKILDQRLLMEYLNK